MQSYDNAPLLHYIESVFLTVDVVCKLNFLQFAVLHDDCDMPKKGIRKFIVQISNVSRVLVCVRLYKSIVRVKDFVNN